MGINISVYRLIEHIKGDYPYWETEDIPFDSLRYGGDHDFVWESDLEWEEEVDDPDSFSRSYNRPKDFDKAREWIEANIHPVNRQRLLELMDKMKQDPKIYIYVSY